MSHPSRHDPPQPSSIDYDHDIIAPKAIQTAIAAANAFEVLGGNHPRLSLTRAEYESLPQAVNAGYPNRPVPLGMIWRTESKKELYVAHALRVTTDGCVDAVEWFDVTISDE